MSRKSTIGPELELLLSERDDLRIKINMADNGGGGSPEDLWVMRRRLVDLDRQILKRWETPNA